MIIGAEGAGAVAPPVVPAAASLALAPILRADPAPAFVLGSSDAAVWLDVDGAVVVLSASDAVRLPNGVTVAAASSERPFAAAAPGEPAVVGGKAAVFGSLRIEAVRWFDPRPALPPATASAVARRIAAAAGTVVPMIDHGFAEAISRDDHAAAVEAAGALIGSGDGLTPRGDDVVAGTISGALLLGLSVGARRVVAAVDGLERPITRHAARATTAFSATLLRHAFRGEVAAPAAVLLEALAGRGDPVAAAKGLQAVGHSSGPALASGVLAGARAAVERSR